jgi:hypothetical protein
MMQLLGKYYIRFSEFGVPTKLVRPVKSVCSFVWVWNSISDIRGRTGC